MDALRSRRLIFESFICLFEGHRRRPRTGCWLGGAAARVRPRLARAAPVRPRRALARPSFPVGTPSRLLAHRYEARMVSLVRQGAHTTRRSEGSLV